MRWLALVALVLTACGGRGPNWAVVGDEPVEFEHVTAVLDPNARAIALTLKHAPADPNRFVGVTMLVPSAGHGRFDCGSATTTQTPQVQVVDPRGFYVTVRQRTPCHVFFARWGEVGEVAAGNFSARGLFAFGAADAPAFVDVEEGQFEVVREPDASP